MLSLLDGRDAPNRERAIREVAASASKDAEEAFQLLEERDSPEWQQFLDWRAARPNLLPVRCEMNVYSEEHALAGQLDALFWDEQAKHFTLVDWKRVAALEREAYGGRTGKPPFQNVSDCNTGHYFVRPLQLTDPPRGSPFLKRSSLMRRFFSLK